MSTALNKLRLGAIIAITFAVVNSDGTKDEAAQIGNANLSLENVKDAAGNDVDPSLFATFEEVSESVDKATVTSDENAAGWSGTFVAEATVTWPIEGGEPVVKTLRAEGHAELVADPSAGDTLEMIVTLQDA